MSFQPHMRAGAMAKLSRLTEEERMRGILTVSAGNHGLAVAHGAEALKLDAQIIVPRSAGLRGIRNTILKHYPMILEAWREHCRTAEK